MYTTRLFNSGIVVAVLVSGLLLGGCNSGAPDESSGADANSEAGAESMAAGQDVESVAAGSGQAGDARAIISEDMPYAEVGDHLAYGYFVAPSDMIEPLPAVVMIHEWWGLNDHIRAMADRLAAQGYIVLAIDLFGGETATSPAAARKLMLSVVEDPESANENVRSAFEFVSETAGAPTVGVIGWRFGGTWALNTALLFPDELDAAVIYYGSVTSDEDRLRPVNTPILALFASDDVSVKIESIEEFKGALERLRKDYDVQIYAGVGQDFANESAKNYDAAAADDAWNRTLSFLERHLSDDPVASEGT